MGNQVGVCREPPQLAELFPLRDDLPYPPHHHHHHPSNGEHAGAGLLPLRDDHPYPPHHPLNNGEHGEDGSFSSYVQMWRFYTDGGDDMFIKDSPVKLGAFKKFDSKDCYIALHIFKNYYNGDATKYPSSTHEPSPHHHHHGTSSYSLHELVVSSIDELTPRGIASSFGTLTLEPFIHTTREEYTHDLYVWNGKSSTPLAKAVALAKGFEIERVLVKEKTTSTVYRRFARGPKSSLSSIFRDDFEEGSKPGDSRRFDVNHLFRQLMSPHKRPSTIKIGELFTTHHQADHLPRFEVLRKTLHKFEPTISSPSPSPSSHSPPPPSHNRSSEPPRPKVPSLPLHALPTPSQQQRLDDATPRPKVPPIFVKAATEGSLKLPSHYTRMANNALSFDTPRDPSEFNEEDYSMMEPAKLLNLFEPLLSRILDFLFLSSRIPPANKDLLRHSGVSHILNCAGDHCANHFQDDFKYKTYYISDSSGEDITCLFYETLDFIEEARQSGGRVLVHCSQGVSRSTSFVILYLMWQFRWDFTKAHEWVRAIRFISNPNPGFTGQLMQWHKRTLQLPSRPRALTIPPPLHAPPQPSVTHTGSWTLPLATPRNSVRNTPLTTPRGPRTSPDSLSSTFDHSSPPSLASVFDNPQLAPRNHHPSPSCTPFDASSPPPPTPRPSTLLDPTPTPRGEPPLRPMTIPTHKIIPLHITLSTPTPGEPPPNTSSTLPSIPTIFLHQPKALTRTTSDPTPSTLVLPYTPPPTRLYRMAAHSHRAFVVPKSLPDPFTSHSLDPRGCFALCTPAYVFLWIGARCAQPLVDGARRAVDKLQRYESAASCVEDTYQCHESPVFWEYFSGGAGEVVDNAAYIDYLLPNPN